MWWALQTVTTVGYGDVTPTEFAGRLVGAAVMLEGTAFVAIVTAVITSSFVTRATREHDAARVKDDLNDREMMERRFDELERKLDVLVTAREDQRSDRAAQMLGCYVAGTGTVSGFPVSRPQEVGGDQGDCAAQDGVEEPVPCPARDVSGRRTRQQDRSDRGESAANDRDRAG